MISNKNNCYKNKDSLKKELVSLSNTELCEIFNIIRSHTDKYTENNNGVFINLKHLDNTTINKIWDFIEFSKQNKVILDRNNTYSNNGVSNSNLANTNTHNSFTMDKNAIHNELNRLKNINVNDTFSFQNFLDKLSSNNLKHFSSTEKIYYPSLKTSKNKFDGVKARLIKKCRDVNKYVPDSNCKYSLDVSNNSFYHENDNIYDNDGDLGYDQPGIKKPSSLIDDDDDEDEDEEDNEDDEDEDDEDDADEVEDDDDDDVEEDSDSDNYD